MNVYFATYPHQQSVGTSGIYMLYAIFFFHIFNLSKCSRIRTLLTWPLKECVCVNLPLLNKESLKRFLDWHYMFRSTGFLSHPLVWSLTLYENLCRFLDSFYKAFNFVQTPNTHSSHSKQPFKENWTSLLHVKGITKYIHYGNCIPITRHGLILGA